MDNVMEVPVQQQALISLQRHGGVAVLLFNRPEQGNAWSPALGKAYFSMLDMLARDAQTRAIVVTGAGKHFCVGADPNVLGSIAAKGEHTPANDTAERERPYYFPMLIGKPVIAAINGACFGVGFQQALCCDIRIVADDCKFSTAYARRGLIAELGMSWLLPRIAGTGRAMDWLLSARVVRAAEAMGSGLANQLCPAGDLLDEAVNYARILAEKCSPRSMREMKQQVALDLVSNLPDAYRRAGTLLDSAYQFPDFREGITSWREGREPAFPSLPESQAFLNIPPMDFLHE